MVPAVIGSGQSSRAAWLGSSACSARSSIWAAGQNSTSSGMSMATGSGSRVTTQVWTVCALRRPERCTLPPEPERNRSETQIIELYELQEPLDLGIFGLREHNRLVDILLDLGHTNFSCERGAFLLLVHRMLPRLSLRISGNLKVPA